MSSSLAGPLVVVSGRVGLLDLLSGQEQLGMVQQVSLVLLVELSENPLHLRCRAVAVELGLRSREWLRDFLAREERFHGHA